MMEKRYIIGLSSLLTLAATNALANNFYLQGGVHFGGDDLITATLTNGDTEKLKGGQLLSVSAGYGIDLSEQLESRFLVGVKFDNIEASNGSADFFRYPVNALLMYKTSEKVKLGGGLTYHMNPSITGDGLARGLNVDFDNALGLVLQLDYLFGNGGYLGVKLTSIDYEFNGAQASGNSVGALIGFAF